MKFESPTPREGGANTPLDLEEERRVLQRSKENLAGMPAPSGVSERENPIRPSASAFPKKEQPFRTASQQTTGPFDLDKTLATLRASERVLRGEPSGMPTVEHVEPPAPKRGIDAKRSEKIPRRRKEGAESSPVSVEVDEKTGNMRHVWKYVRVFTAAAALVGAYEYAGSKKSDSSLELPPSPPPLRQEVGTKTNAPTPGVVIVEPTGTRTFEANLPPIIKPEPKTLETNAPPVTVLEPTNAPPTITIPPEGVPPKEEIKPIKEGAEPPPTIKPEIKSGGETNAPPGVSPETKPETIPEAKRTTDEWLGRDEACKKLEETLSASVSASLLNRIKSNVLIDALDKARAEKGKPQEVPRVKVSGFEHVSPDTAKLMNIVLDERNGFYPKGWIDGKISTVSYLTNEPPQIGARYGSGMSTNLSAGNFNYNGRHINLFTNQFNVKGETVSFSVLDGVNAHEIGHANDWCSNSSLSYKERLQLLSDVINRLSSPDRYESAYVERITRDDVQSTLEVKATEYYAEICEQTLRFSSKFKRTHPQDFELVQNAIRKSDAHFNPDAAWLAAFNLQKTEGKKSVKVRGKSVPSGRYIADVVKDLREHRQFWRHADTK